MPPAAFESVPEEEAWFSAGILRGWATFEGAIFLIGGLIVSATARATGASKRRVRRFWAQQSPNSFQTCKIMASLVTESGNDESSREVLLRKIRR